MFEFGRPDRQHGLVRLERAVPHQQAQQITLRRSACALPSAQSALVLQQHFVARLQRSSGYPLGLQRIACFVRDAAHAVVRSQAQAVAFTGLQAKHGLYAR